MHAHMHARPCACTHLRLSTHAPFPQSWSWQAPLPQGGVCHFFLSFFFLSFVPSFFFPCFLRSFFLSLLFPFIVGKVAGRKAARCGRAEASGAGRREEAETEGRAKRRKKKEGEAAKERRKRTGGGGEGDAQSGQREAGRRRSSLQHPAPGHRHSAVGDRIPGGSRQRCRLPRCQRCRYARASALCELGHPRRPTLPPWEVACLGWWRRSCLPPASPCGLPSSPSCPCAALLPPSLPSVSHQTANLTSCKRKRKLGREEEVAPKISHLGIL